MSFRAKARADNYMSKINFIHSFATFFHDCVTIEIYEHDLFFPNKEKHKNQQ